MNLSCTLPIVLDAVVKASADPGRDRAGRRASSAARRRRARHMVWTLGLLSALARAGACRWRCRAGSCRSSGSRAPRDRRATASRRSRCRLPARLRRIRDGRRRCDRRSRPSAAAEPRDRITTRRRRDASAWPTIAAVASGSLARPLILGAHARSDSSAVQWMSRRTPVVTDAPWLPQARALARGARHLARPLPPQRRGDDADGVGHLPPVGADAGGRRHLAGRAAAHRAAARARAREAPRLPDAPPRADRVRGATGSIRWRGWPRGACAPSASARATTWCSPPARAAPTTPTQLLEIARVMRAGRFPAVLAGASLAMAHRSQLEGRLMAILDPSVPRRGLTRASRGRRRGRVRRRCSSRSRRCSPGPRSARP